MVNVTRLMQLADTYRDHAEQYPEHDSAAHWVAFADLLLYAQSAVENDPDGLARLERAADLLAEKFRG